jgi:hypothetical protein
MTSSLFTSSEQWLEGLGQPLQQRRKTSLIVAAAAGSAAAACNEKVWLVWRWVAGRMFAAAAILALMLATAKRVVSRKAASKVNKTQFGL